MSPEFQQRRSGGGPPGGSAYPARFRCGAAGVKVGVIVVALRCISVLAGWVVACGICPATHGEVPGRVVRSTGTVVPELAPFDRLMESFLADHQIPGASLAVGRDDRLLYARAFGRADVERPSPVRPDSLFRIASVSKPITAVAVLRLVEQGRVMLDAPMMRYLGPDVLIEPPLDERWRQITVRHLLQHRGGWDRSQSFDPMFQSRQIVEEMAVAAPADPIATIRYMARRRLDFEPGARYAYSNFGYCLLGRLIEQATGKDYEAGVRELVLDHVAVDSFFRGRTERGFRRDDEVVYYTNARRKAPSVFRDERVEPPYGAWCLETMDAHGGWVASAPALVRLVNMTFAGSSLLLARSSVDLAIERPDGLAGWTSDGEPRPAYYGLGWMIRPVGEQGWNIWHAGSLPGTNSLLVRRHDGLSWAVLFNTRDLPGPGDPVSLIDPLLHRAADAVERWPDPALDELDPGPAGEPCN